jgi:hypothetical protein
MAVLVAKRVQAECEPKGVRVPVPDDFNDTEGLLRVSVLVVALLSAGVPVRELLRRLAGWQANE